jgi:deoxyxylulose-5-phosphate synthase
VLNGGVTSIISRKINEMAIYNNYTTKPHVFGFGIDDEFVPHGKIAELNKSLGLDSDSEFNKILQLELSNQKEV